MLLICSILSAGIFSLALPSELVPWGSPLLGCLCLVPHFWALSKTRSYAHAAVLGAVFGGLSHSLSSYWLLFFHDFAVWTLAASAGGYMLLHALVAPILRYFSIGFEPSSLSSSKKSLNKYRPFLLAAAWTAWEWFKSIGFTGYPWGLVAYAVNNISFLTQIVDITGVYGLSFLLALCNTSIVEFIRTFKPQAQWLKTIPVAAASFIAFFILFAYFSLYGIYKLKNPTPTIDVIPMVLVQHNDNSWDNVHDTKMNAIMRAQQLTREGINKINQGEMGAEYSQPELIVWSESVLPYLFTETMTVYENEPRMDPFLPFLKEIKVPLLTGAPFLFDPKEQKISNSALLFVDSKIAYEYGKQHLVPFAEGIPFWEYSWMRSFIKNTFKISTWFPGEKATIMKLERMGKDPLYFGVPICFEDAFSQTCANFIRAGADMLINITNNSWSNTDSAEIQHLIAARFRSIESRRVLVRSSNSGATVVINAEGTILDSLPLFKEESLSILVPIQKSDTPTVYLCLGDWLPKLFLCILFLSVLLRFFHFRKNP